MRHGPVSVSAEADAGLVRLLPLCGSAPWSLRAESCPASVPTDPQRHPGAVQGAIRGARVAREGIRHATMLPLLRETARWKHAKLVVASQKAWVKSRPRGALAEGLESFEKF